MLRRVWLAWQFILLPFFLILVKTRASSDMNVKSVGLPWNKSSLSYRPPFLPLDLIFIGPNWVVIYQPKIQEIALAFGLQASDFMCMCSMWGCLMGLKTWSISLEDRADECDPFPWASTDLQPNPVVLLGLAPPSVGNLATWKFGGVTMESSQQASGMASFYIF